MSGSVCYSVRQQRIDRGTDGVHILMSSPEGALSFSRSSFMHFRLSISNVLSEFYHILHLEVIPLDDECTDWCTVEDVIVSLKKKVSHVNSHSGER